MAERFNLTAQLQLQAPTNIPQVVSQIRRQLKGINVDVKVKANTPQVAKLNKELQGVSKASDASTKSVRLMNASLVQAAKRFSVFTVVTGSLIALTRGIKEGTKEAIAFEKELIKISQVTGRSVARLQGLTKEVTRLSTSLGVSSSELLNVSRTLAQAGFSAQKTKRALETLAQTTLAATFDNIKDTTEGAIAVLRQFSDEAKRTGGDIKFLASTMDAINSVSKRFAVESGDLITVIRRVGGVFSAAGGKVNELIALFTSVRATTRESAETIATGLRTIFTRIQRTDTVDQLKALGIQLRDSKGQFVGAYEAVRRLSVGLSTLDPRDFRFSDIVESLGGFRQVGKVIPLIQQFATAQAALSVAQSSSGSVARDAAKAQLGLGVEITKVKQEFGALLRQFADSSTFRSIAGGALQLAGAFIEIASALEKVLPLITTMISMKIGQALAPGLGALMGGVGLRRRNQGGKIHAFARGGYVPGTGNRDTVPAMLTPGEFVIKKSSVKKLGSDQLHAMNQNRYNKAGKFKDLSQGKSFKLGMDKNFGVAKQATLKKLGDKDGDSMFDIVGAFLQPTGIVDQVRAVVPSAQVTAQLSKLLGTKLGIKGQSLKSLAEQGLPELKDGLPINIISGSTGTRAANKFRVDVRNKLSDAASTFNKEKGLPFAKDRFKAGYRKANYQQIEGNVFEAAIAAAAGGVPYNDGRESANAAIDFPGGVGPKLGPFFGVPGDLPADAKRTFNQGNVASLVKKAATVYLNAFATEVARLNVGKGEGEEFIKGRKSKEQLKLAERSAGQKQKLTIDREKQIRARKASGGGISGSDTVPALLTPGEFVINKSSAQSIGYSNLSKMNQTGVKGFAAGGVVGGVQRFAEGGAVAGGVAGLDKIAQAAQQFAFLGAMAASVGSQFTGLEESTQAAISATSASVASWVGIGGTLVQVFTAMAGAGTTAAAASTTAAAADMEESAASKMAATSGGGFTKGLGLFVIGLTAAYAAAEFFKQTLIAESAALSKGIAESIKRLEEGTGTGTEIAGQQLQQVELDVATEEFSTLNVVIAVATTALAAFVGVFALITAPAWGTVAAVTGLVGALGGLLGFFQESTDATDKAAEAAKRQEEAIKESAAAMISSTNSLKSFDDAVTKLGERQFVDTAEGRSEKIQATGDVVDQGLGSFGGGITAEANNRLEALADVVGKSTGELTAADFKGDNVQFKAEFENLISILETNSEGLKGTLQQAQSNFTAAVKEDVTGELGFEELRAKGGNFAKTLDQLQEATKASFEAERQRVQALINSTQGNKKANDAAVAQMKDLNDQEKKISEEQIKYAKDVAAAAQERHDADLQAARATQELSRRMDAISQFSKDVELLGQAAKDAANAMDLRIAAFSDGDIQVKIPEISGLADPTNVADPDRFNQQIESLIADLPRAMQSGASQQADAIRRASDLFGGFRSSVRARRAGKDEIPGDVARQILADSGLNVPIGGQLETQLIDDLTVALNEPGGLSDEKFNKIFSFVKDEADEAAKNLGKLNKTRQVEIETHKKYITALDEQRQRENAARQQLIKTQIRGEKIRAKARGKSVDIGRLEAARRAQAQAGLRGTNLVAGDAEGAFAAILNARLRRQQIADQLSSGNLREGQTYEQLQTEQLKYNNIIKAAQGELKRLGDQSGRVADLQAEIEKEAKGRKQFAQFGTGFAFDSDQGRRNTARGLADTRLAIGSMRMGRGLQGATEEQRASVSSILDSLSDYRGFGVINPQTGEQMSGKEIKAELARQEILRTTGDQQMAAAIKGEILKGSKEEQLIKALDNLTFEIQYAARLSLRTEDAMSPAPAQQQANGGLVYKADGGSIFQPKGTDTVPAMLTPGEFVIKKSSVDRIGVGNLQALNDGVQYHQDGGGVQYLRKGSRNAAGRLHRKRREAGLEEGMYGADFASGAIVAAGSAMGKTGFTKAGNPATMRNLLGAVGGHKGALIGEGIDIGSEGIAGAIHGGVKGFGTGLGVGYGGMALATFAGEAASLALDPEGTTQRYADANTKQTQKTGVGGYLSNVGANLIHPGTAAMQLGQSVIGGKKHQRQTFKPMPGEVPSTHADYGKKEQAAIEERERQARLNNLNTFAPLGLWTGGPIYHQDGGKVQYLKNGGSGQSWFSKFLFGDNEEPVSKTPVSKTRFADAYIEKQQAAKAKRDAAIALTPEQIASNQFVANRTTGQSQSALSSFLWGPDARTNQATKGRTPEEQKQIAGVEAAGLSQADIMQMGGNTSYSVDPDWANRSFLSKTGKRAKTFIGTFAMMMRRGQEDLHQGTTGENLATVPDMMGDAAGNVMGMGMRSVKEGELDHLAKNVDISSQGMYNEKLRDWQSMEKASQERMLSFSGFFGGIEKWSGVTQKPDASLAQYKNIYDPAEERTKAIDRYAAYEAKLEAWKKENPNWDRPEFDEDGQRTFDERKTPRPSYKDHAPGYDMRDDMQVWENEQYRKKRLQEKKDTAAANARIQKAELKLEEDYQHEMDIRKIDSGVGRRGENPITFSEWKAEKEKARKEKFDIHGMLKPEFGGKPTAAQRAARIEKEAAENLAKEGSVSERLGLDVGMEGRDVGQDEFDYSYKGKGRSKKGKSSIGFIGDRYNPKTNRYEDKDGKTAQERDAAIILEADKKLKEKKYGKIVVDENTTSAAGSHDIGLDSLLSSDPPPAIPRLEGGEYNPNKRFIGPKEQKRIEEEAKKTDFFPERVDPSTQKIRDVSPTSGEFIRDSKDRKTRLKELQQKMDDRNSMTPEAFAEKYPQKDKKASKDKKARQEARNAARRAKIDARTDIDDEEKKRLKRGLWGSERLSREESMAASKKRRADRKKDFFEDVSIRNEANREGRLEDFMPTDKRNARDERREAAFGKLAEREKKAQDRRDEISKNRQAAANKRRGRQKFRSDRRNKARSMQYGNQSVSSGYVGGAAAPGTPTPQEISYERNEYIYYMRKKERARADWEEFQRWKRERGGRGYAGGGSIPSSSDTVPAMLTPGEFVMSREAVQSHGVGYMKQLNKGHVPGFNRGGVVGTGNVSYLNGGSKDAVSGGGLMSSMLQGAGAMLGLDTSDLSGILEGFQGGLISGLDGVVKQFTGVEGAFTNLAATFSNLTMQHSFSGDMTLAFNITNADAIKNAVADAITPKITEIINNELDVRLDKDFKLG